MLSLPFIARAFVGFGMGACAACVAVAPRPDAAEASRTFYTVTAEIALSRHEPRVAALEYAAVADTDRDPALLRRATDVTVQCLQPSLTLAVAGRWLQADSGSVDAHRAAGRAALELHRIDESAAHYRAVFDASPRGLPAEWAALDTELQTADDVYGARQLADRLAVLYPGAASSRLQAYAALRADDPATAVRDFEAALAATTAAGGALDDEAGQELQEGLWRARILSGDPTEPLAQAETRARNGGSEEKLDFAVLLLAAQRLPAARTELDVLTQDREAAPAAERLLGLIDFQEGRMEEAEVHFTALLASGKFVDDAAYYLGLIAERHDDFAQALRSFAQVQAGDNALPSLLRAAALLHAHGAVGAAEEILDRLVEEEPGHAPDILVSRARLYADAGDLAAASVTLNQALLEYPDNVELRYASATMAEQRGDVAQSLRELKALLALRPNDPAALNAYGYTLADHDRQLHEARRLIEQAYAAAPRSAAILDSFGWVLFRQGRGEQALPYLTKAYDEDHGGDIAAHLGEVLWHLGRADEAERIWSEADRIDADNALLRSTRSRLHGPGRGSAKTPPATPRHAAPPANLPQSVSHPTSL